MLAVFKRELRSYFQNAIGYVYVGVFLSLSALLCCYTTLMAGTYDTSAYFSFLTMSFIVLIPLLTMRLFSEEKKLRTEQLMLTAPISLWGMVFGKFLAAFTLFLGGVAVSCINFLPLVFFGSAEKINDAYGASIGPVAAVILSSLLGIVCIGAAFIALGMFVSSLTENQLAAAIITVVIICIMLLIGTVTQYIESYPVRYVINFISVMSRFSTFGTGQLDPSALLYYLSFSGIFLFLTERVYEKRRWS